MLLYATVGQVAPLAASDNSEEKSRLLRVDDRKKLSNSLDSLDLPSLCQEVESIVSKGMHLTIFPDRKALWDTVKGSDALSRLITAAKKEFVLLYNKCGKGANKQARFLHAWMQYMLSHTRSSPSAENQMLWKDLITSYPHEVSEDTRRIIVCEVLQTVQCCLTSKIAADLESLSTKSLEDGHASSSSSDDTALSRIGGWAILSALKFWMKCVKQQRGNINQIKEEITLLKELRIPDKEKDSADLSEGLKALDRGGLTYPKKELLPYLQETERHILELLNDTNYKRYGYRLFEV